MLYTEYKNWLSRNCPFGMDEEDFKDFVAMCGALTVQNTIEHEGLTVSELIDRLFEKPKLVN